MAKRRKPPGSESAGYHYDASIPDYQPKTPTGTPSPGEAAKGPAGDYSGAEREYSSAVQALPAAAQAVTEHATEKAEAAAKAQQAATRQRHLVSRYVTRAYSKKLEHKGVSTLEVGARIKRAKGQLEKDRERLLSHPKVQEANAEGKVVSAKGLSRIRRTKAQQSAISGPSGLEVTKEHGVVPRSLTLGRSESERLARNAGNPQGSAGRSLAQVHATEHERTEPSNLEVLGYASLGVPGVGVGGDLAKLGELGAEAVPKLLAGGGAKQVVKDAAENLGAKAAAKGAAIKAAPKAAATAAKNLPKAIRELPEVLRTEAPQAIKAGAKAAPRYAGKKAVGSGEKSLQAFSGLGALGALHQGGIDVPGGTILEGQGKALAQDPGKVFASTANLAPALLTSAFQLPIAAGKSAIEGNSAPLEGALSEQANYFKHLADVYGSSDAKKIEKATLEEGLLPEVLGGPLAYRGGDLLTKGLRSKAADAAEAKRLPAMDEKGNVLTDEQGYAVRKGRRPSPVKRQREAADQRREEAMHGAYTGDKADIDAAWRENHLEQAARKAAGKQTAIRDGLGEKGKDTLNARPPDFIPFLAKAHIDLDKPEAALKEIQHYADLYKGQRSPVEAGINPEALTARDAVRYFKDHPEELGKPELRTALDAYREVSNGTGEWEGARPIGYSARNNELGPAVAHGRFLPEQYAPLDAAAHVSPEQSVAALRSRASELRQKAETTKSEKKAERYRSEASHLDDVAKRSEEQGTLTREGAWAEHGRRKRSIEQLAKQAREKQIEARSAPEPRRSLLRAEAKTLAEQAKLAESARKDLHGTLKDFTRPGAKPDYNSKRTAYSQGIENQFVKDMAAFKAERGLHPEGAYVPDQAPIDTATPDSSVTGGQKPLEGAPKINEGKVWRQGFSRQGIEHLKNEGILRPLRRAHQYDNGRRFITERSITYNGEQERTGKEWGDAERHGVTHAEDVVYVPRQVYKRLERTVHGGETTAYEDAVKEALTTTSRSADTLGKGTVYRAFPKAAWEEFVAQQGGDIGLSALRKVNRATSRVMLSTPAFVAAQAVAESAQSAAAVSPHWSALGLHDYGKLSWDQKVRISAAAGETASSVFSPERVNTVLKAEGTKPFKDSLGFFQRNLLGRVAKDTLTLKIAGEIDRLKGSRIRRATLTGEIARDLNNMRSKVRRMMGRQRELEKKLEGKSRSEQLAYIADHPDELMKYMHDLHGMMGGWNNLTRTGHIPETTRSAALIFYPYVRMSLEWPLRYAGRHPAKATLLAYAAAENNFALREALHGEPSFLNYAQVPTWKEGPDGKPTYDDTINLSRIAPGGNFITQSVQGSGNLLGALQPGIVAGIEGLTGKGPLGDVNGVEGAIGGLLGLSPYVRAANNLRGQAASGQSQYSILGKRANLALDPLAKLSSILKGDKGHNVLNTLAGGGFLPQDLQHQRDYAKLGRILTKLGDTGSEAQNGLQPRTGTASEQRSIRSKVQRMQKENKKAEGELEKLYAKYGLSKVAARSTEVYEYTHPYPDEQKSPFESAGFESDGSAFEGGWGGGESPVKVPQESDALGLSLPSLGSALGAVASPLSSLIGGTPAQAAELPKGASKAIAQNTAGSPTQQEVFSAGRAGTLEVNRSGKLTTPKVRRAAKELARAESAALPKITGFEHGDQQQFAQYLAKYTGLDPQFVGAWVKAEGGGASNGGEAGKNNWLGVGYPGQQTPFSQSAYFNRSPKEAAKATAQWMEGKIGAQYGYQAAASIQSIIPVARGKGPEAALQALSTSGWGTNVDSIAQNLSGVSVQQGNSNALRVAKRNARKVGLNPTPWNGDVEAGPGKTVTVRADARGMVNWAKSAEGTPEGSAKQLRWAANEGLSSSEPWCANFISNGLARRGVQLPSNPNYVPSYESGWSGGRNIGTNLAQAKPGDLVAFSGNHIGLYVGNGEMISGNYGDEVARSPVDSGLSAILRPNYRGGKVQVHETAALPGGTPAATFGNITPSGSVESSAVSLPSESKPAKGQKKQGQTAAQRLQGLERILGGNLTKFGVPQTEGVGPTAADLAAIAEALEKDRRKLLIPGVS